ncbi:MAG: DUF4857 domain-containing protein, partial [Muribaculaceae bacterium]|nr:DUF4857 domain-containing protein [Muribaculaceae bacterium]
MRQISKIFLIVICTMALSWFLPWLWSFITPSTSSTPFCAYSPILNNWIIASDTNSSNKRFHDTKGNNYNTAQRDSLLPQLYYRDLMAHDRMPDRINGVNVTIPTLKHSEMVFMSNPRDVNKRAAKLMCIMESLPGRVDLSDPTEAFRMNGSMEFIKMTTNEVNTDRSKRFSETLKNRGFQYPLYDYSANITAKKNYDEGYLMVDAIGNIFHVKQMAGRPYVAAIPQPDNMRAEKVYIMENTDHTKLGFVIDTEYNIYMLRHDSKYYLTKMPVGKVNPHVDRIVIMGNMFNMV